MRHRLPVLLSLLAVAAGPAIATDASQASGGGTNTPFRDLAAQALSILESTASPVGAEPEASPFTPPGHGGTPPGQGGIPPGQTTPPGQGGTPPGQGGTAPGQGGGPPPGQGGGQPPGPGGGSPTSPPPQG
jgi:hypothetical protein